MAADGDDRQVVHIKLDRGLYAAAKAWCENEQTTFTAFVTCATASAVERNTLDLAAVLDDAREMSSSRRSRRPSH